MPTFFRPRRTARRIAGRRKNVIVGSSILTAIGTASGIASVSGIGVARILVVGSTAGSVTVEGVGVGIRAVVGAASGAASVNGQGSGYIVTVGASAGAAAASGIPELRQIISTNIIQKPVDYWLAGELAPERMRVSKNIMRSIFRE